jgi:hypothetical protein
MRTLLIIAVGACLCVGARAQTLAQPSSGSAGTVTANNGSAGCVAHYAAAGGSTTVGADANLCDSGSVWNAAEGITFTGNTTAANTITGTVAITLAPGGTNPVFLPAGTPTTGGIAFTGDAVGAGIYNPANSIYGLKNGTNEFMRLLAAGIKGVSGGCYGMTASSTSSTGAYDTGMGRSAAGVFNFNTDTGCSNGQGKLKAAAYISTGTTFTGNAGCSETTLVGGAAAGKFTAVSTSCTVILTLGNSATAPNGWSCWAHDLTTAADYNNPRISASSATTVTIVTGTIVSSDVIEFGCVGY